MDPMYETMLWYLAYIHKLNTQAGEAQLAKSTLGYGRTMRYRLVRWCGHAALRVGTWLLAEELRTGAEHAEAPRTRVASRS